MLVLTRNVGKKVFIGKDGLVEISIIEIRGNQVKLGIKAPSQITVDRSEVAEVKQKNAQKEKD